MRVVQSRLAPVKNLAGMENYTQITLRHEIPEKFNGKCYRFNVPVKTRLYLNTTRENWYATCNYLQLPEISKSYSFKNETRKYINCFKFERLLSNNEEAYYNYQLCRNKYADGVGAVPYESLTDAEHGFEHPEIPVSYNEEAGTSYRSGRSSELYSDWVGDLFTGSAEETNEGVEVRTGELSKP